MTTNAEILDNYNEYLQTHNLVQSNEAFDFLVGTKVYPIQLDLFLGYLVDQIALQVVGTKSFRDPLDKFYKEDVKFGTVIQDIQTISGYDFNDYDVKDFEKDVQNPFKKEPNRVSEIFHNNILRKKLKQTLTYDQLDSAVKNEYGLQTIINSFINDITVDLYSWEYKTKLNLLSSDWAKSIKIQAPTNTDKKGYGDFAIKVKKVVRDFTYNNDSYKYNRSVIPMPIDPSKIAIIISADFADKVDVEYFTGLFNMSLAEIKGRITYINHFPQKNRVCLICDEKGLFFHRILNKKTKLENPADLTWNAWTHFWRNLSVSKNYNAVAIDLWGENEENATPIITIDGEQFNQEENLAWNEAKTVVVNVGNYTDVVDVYVNGVQVATLNQQEQSYNVVLTNEDYKEVSLKYVQNGEHVTKNYAFRTVLPASKTE